MKLNKRQKQIFIAVLVILIVSFLYPPYQQPLGRGVTKFYGFHLIASDIFADIHVGFLLVEWLLILIIGASLVFYFKDE